MKLPFLQESKWPTAREPGEKIVNQSYDGKIEDHLMDEVIQAIEHKDSGKLRESLVALIQHLKSEDQDG